jgi:hypothetical protein
MLTSTAPMRAVANCAITHSNLFGDQMPTRSPRWIPRAMSARARVAVSSTSALYVAR